MTEGIVRIYMSYVEPEDKNLLWMRPCLHPHEGYDLLYFGSGGWHVWIRECGLKDLIPPGNPGDKDKDENITPPDDCSDDWKNAGEDKEDPRYEIVTPGVPCGCLKG